MVRNEATRKYIIEKTAPIFNKKGFTGTYLSDLTAATGLSKGSIYGNFKDKSEVALEAFRYNVGRLTYRIITKTAGIPHAADKLLFFVKFYRRNYQRVFENGGCALLNTAVDADDGNEMLRQEVVKAIHSWKQNIEDTVQEGVTKGHLKPVDKEKFSSLMMALVEGSLLLSKTTSNPRFLMNNLEFLEKEIRMMRA